MVDYGNNMNNNLNGHVGLQIPFDNMNNQFNNGNWFRYIFFYSKIIV